MDRVIIRKAENEIFNTNTTGVLFYDNLFGGRGDEVDNAKDILQKDYYAKYKGVIGSIVMMSPDEYLAEIPYLEPSEEKMNRLRKAVQDGKKLNLPYIDYTSGKPYCQEGRHRAYLAKEMGIEEMPVLIVMESKLPTRIVHKQADNIDLVVKDLPDVKQDRTKYKDELKENFNRGYKRRFRNEPYGIHEQLLEGQEGYLNQDNVMGTDNSWNDNL